MTNDKQLLACTIILLFAISFFPVGSKMIPIVRSHTNSFSSFVESNSLPSISVGNWVITGNEENKSESILLSGNLTIESGGNLTLVNDTLTVNPQYVGEYGITVNLGGSLYIYNSTVTSSNLTNRYSFFAQGSNFVLEDSILHGVGWCTQSLSSCGGGTPNPKHGDPDYEGPTIETNSAIIEKNLISENLIGMVLLGSYSTVSRNNFSSNDVSVLDLGTSSYDKIIGNFFHQYSLFNTWESNIADSNNNLFYNNTMTYTVPPVLNGSWPGTGGFNLYDSSNNVFSSNYLYDGQPIAAVGYGTNSNNSVIDNTIISQDDQAILFQGDAYTRVIGNSIRLIPEPITGFNEGGIMLEGSPFSTVANNTMTSNSGGEYSTPLFLDQSPGSSVINNNFDVSFPPVGPCLCEPSAAVYLYDSYNDKIMGNLINGGMGQGIWLAFGSDNNTITDNSVGATNPPLRSIVIDSSSNNLIYGNDFYDYEGPYDGGMKNTWTNFGTGNFWSYWQGSGPFKIPPNGSDNSPLSKSIAIVNLSVVPLIEGPASPPSGQSLNLDVTGKSTIANTNEKISSGNIYIENGGELVISNSTLTFDPSFQVSISQGGTLVVEGSSIVGGSGFSDNGNLTVIHSDLLVGQNVTFEINFAGVINISNSLVDAQGPFGFIVENRNANGAGSSNISLNIENSDLEGGSLDWGGTAAVYSSSGSLFMNNVTMTESYEDLIFSGDSATVINCTFIGGGNGIFVTALNGTFSDNRLLDQPKLSLSAGIVSSNNEVILLPPVTSPPDPNGAGTITTTSSSSSTTSISTSSSTTISSSTTTSTSTVHPHPSPYSFPILDIALATVSVIIVAGATVVFVKKHRPH